MNNKQKNYTKDQVHAPNATNVSGGNGALTEIESLAAAQFLATASDLVFIINADGVIINKVLYSSDYSGDLFKDWSGKAWIDIVSVESRPKVKEMLQDLASGQISRWRQINQNTESGGELPIRIILLKAGTEGHAIAVGRDMRPVASMQQRLVAAELSIEQEYARLRHAETRCRYRPRRFY